MDGLGYYEYPNIKNIYVYLNNFAIRLLTSNRI